MASILHFKKIRNWLTLWLLLLALLPLTFSSLIIYIQRVDAIHSQGIEKLTAIRDFKVKQLNSWFDERIVDLKHIARDYEITRVAQTEAPESEYPHALAVARELLQAYLRTNAHYRDVFLIDAKNGRVILSSAAEDEGLFKLNNDYFTIPLQTRDFSIKDIYYSTTLKQPTMAFSTPVFDPRDLSRILAVLVARCDLEQSVYSLLQDRTGMGETGETLIVNRDGLALNNLRWYDDAPLNLKIAAKPAVLAAQGLTGIIEVEDYRQTEVLAAYKYLPKLKWGFVAKQDASEVFAPVEKMLYDVLTLLIISTAIVFFVALNLSKKLVAPILEMKEVSSKLHNGDLSARNTIERSDEIGFLSASINEMADSIQSQLNVQKRSGEIIETLVSSEDLNAFAQGLLNNLTARTETQLAAFYLRGDDHQTFTPLVSIGATGDNLRAFTGDNLEGELGLALAAKKIVHLSEIAADTRFTFKAVAGEALPKEIISIPLLDRNEVKAIVSLCTLQGFSRETCKILDLSWMPMNTALSNILAGEKTQQLAADLAEKNDELQSQSEELRAQADELRAQADELRHTATELEAQRRQIESADRLKSEFLSNMSHELRTPLNSVLALSQLMISRGTGKNPAEEKEFLGVIERNGRQLLNLINDILDLSKIESGRMDVLRTQFSARAAVRRALDTIEPLAAEKGLQLDIDMVADPHLNSDEDKVHQILLNLLANAVKFTAQGTVAVVLRETPDKVSFVVSDTGIGIPPNELPHIFDEFRQVDGSVTRRHEGTGLGLAICQKLALLLGGQILAESVEGEGSTFTLELPPQELVGDLAQSTDSLSALPAALPATNVDALTQTVLIIDDEAEVRELVGRHLSAAGYDVVLAANGKEGLRLAKELHPFAVTLDILMPDMDGWEVLRKMKADPETTDIPVVMLTVSEDRATGTALGASGYLTKPVEKNILCAELEKLGRARNVKQILIVDDDPIAREQTQSSLEHRGYLVTPAASGEEALRLARDYPPDAVLLDLMMPGMDGFEVLERLRKDPLLYDLPVIVLSAKDLTMEERHLLEKSVKKVVAKSYLDKELLLDEIVAALKQLHGGGPQKDDSGKPLILVVEDNATAALQVQSTLEDNGYAVMVAGGGEEALAKVKRTLPDGVVLDLMMPDVDGFQVLETIRSTPWTEQLPVLVLTAKELSAEDRTRLKQRHVSQLIQKGSVDRTQLLKAVQALLTPPFESPPAAPSSETRPPSVDTGMVLVVEDNPDNMLTVTSVLAELDCEICRAKDGRQAVSMAKSLHPELILMDMQLPEMSGLDATQAIRSDAELKDIQIVALTANAMKGDREKMLAAGCVDYISKPFDPSELLAVVRSRLRNEKGNTYE